MPGRSKNEKYNNIKKKKIETTLEELCKGYPIEFKEFMEYCRSLKFEQDPDYKFMTGLFEKCLQRHNLDPKTQDYTWKQNRLSKDKEALKNSVLNVINKNKKADDPKVSYHNYNLEDWCTRGKSRTRSSSSQTSKLSSEKIRWGTRVWSKEGGN